VLANKGHGRTICERLFKTVPVAVGTFGVIADLLLVVPMSSRLAGEDLVFSVHAEEVAATVFGM
jgi:hypothetical protein